MSPMSVVPGASAVKSCSSEIGDVVLAPVGLRQAGVPRLKDVASRRADGPARLHARRSGRPRSKTSGRARRLALGVQLLGVDEHVWRPGRFGAGREVTCMVDLTRHANGQVNARMLGPGAWGAPGRRTPAGSQPGTAARLPGPRQSGGLSRCWVGGDVHVSSPISRLLDLWT